MIHRAIFGSMERISMVLIEHFAGAFPTWLSSEQVVVVPISDKHNDYAQKIAAELVEADVRAKTDLRAERMNYKIRDAQEKQIPYMLVVGDQEMASNSVSVRYRRGDNSVTMSISDFTDKIKAEIKSKALEGGV
jgi:threonyl-tRNA synthetase